MAKWIAVATFVFLVSPPTVIWDASPNFTPSNRETSYDIDTIVIHTTEGIDSNNDDYYSECYYQAINWFNNSSAGVSAHYVIAPWGEITQMVANDDIAWHATYYNSRSIGIECAGFAGSSYTWTPELLDALADLVAWLAETHDVPVIHPTDDANTWGGWYGNTGIVGHSQVQTSGSAAAASYSTKTDPGPYFPWSSFIDMVKERMAPPPATNLSAVPGVGSVDFSWSAAPGATNYWVDIAKSPADLSSMTGTFQNLFAGPATSATWTGLDPGETYYWRVYGYNTGGGNHAYPAGPVTTSPASSSSSSDSGGCGAAAGSNVIPILFLFAVLLYARKRCSTG